MSEPTVIAAYVVELLDDGSMRHVGFTAEPDEHSKATQAVQAGIPGSKPVDPSAALSGPSIADQIKECQDVKDLATCWRANRENWTAEHNKLAANRKKEFPK